MTVWPSKGYKVFMIDKILLSLAFVVFFGYLSPPLVQADIYRYIDQDGRVHFTNVPTESKYQLYLKTGSQSEMGKLITQFANQFRLEEALLKAVIKVESNFNPKVISSKGAQGLMQLMPGTAREVGVSDPFDPSSSIYGGSRYLRKMLDTFDADLDLALAAYNAGPNAVRKYGTIPPYEETQKYVKRVRYYMDFYRREKDTL